LIIIISYDYAFCDTVFIFATDMNQTTPTQMISSRSSKIFIPVVIVIGGLAAVGNSVLIIAILVLLKKRNKKAKRKTESNNLYPMTDPGAGAFYLSQNDNFYSTVVDKDITSNKNMEDDVSAYAAPQPFDHSNKLDMHQEYYNIDRNMSNEYNQQKVVPDKAEDITQPYSVLNRNTRKWKAEKIGNARDACTSGNHTFSEMYSVLDNKAKNKRQEGNVRDECVRNKTTEENNQEKRNIVDVYAVVNKSAKKKRKF